MAYKFQLGAAKLSGSIEQTDGSSIKAQAEFQIGSTAVDETELSILEGATVSTAELNYLDGADANINSLVLPASTTITSFAASILDDADEATFKATVNLEIGTDVQAYDADLDNLSGMQAGASAALALLTQTEIEILDGATVSTAELNILDGVTSTAAELNYLDGADANINSLVLPASTTISTYGASLVDDADAAAARTTLGLGDIATQDSSSVDIDGGAMDGVVIGANSQAAAEFTTLSASSNLQIGGGAMIAGDLDVSGDLTGSGIALSDASGIAGEGLANNSGVLKFDVAGLALITSNIVVGGSDLLLIYDNDQSEHKRITAQEYTEFLVDADNGSAVSGLSANGARLQANVDDSSIEISSNSMQVKALGITNAMLSGSIENAKLSNSDVSFGGVTVALGASDATPAFDLSDATSYPGDNALVAAGALNAGSITSGFGSINNGSSAITTTGTGSFGKVVVSGDLEVQGDLTYIDTTNLRVSDAKVVFADGASALADGQGWYIGSDAGDSTEKASFAVNLDVDGAGTDGFESSLPIKASRFYGELVGGSVETVQTLTAGATIDTGNGTQILMNHAGGETYTLPAASDCEGLLIKIKKIGAGNPRITTPGSETIDGEADIVIESAYGAVNLISNGSNFFIV